MKILKGLFTVVSLLSIFAAAVGGLAVANGNLALVSRGSMTLLTTEVEGKQAPLTCDTIQYTTVKDKLKLVAGRIEGSTRKMTGGFVEGNALVADGFLPRTWGTAYDNEKIHYGANQVTSFCKFMQF